MNIYTKDGMRAAVEAASDGRVTILYDDDGYPSYMAVIPKFTVPYCDPTSNNYTDPTSDSSSGYFLGAGSGTYYDGYHPAFISSAGVVKDYIFIGVYSSSLINGIASSLPFKTPDTNVNFTTAKSRCTSKGTGWHMLTNWEYSAIAWWTYKYMGNLRGNTNYGFSHSVDMEHGCRVYDEALGDSSNYTGETFTGTGPSSWRHDGSPFGISDFGGNVSTFVDGVRMTSGQFQFLGTNQSPYTTGFNLWDTTHWANSGVYVEAGGNGDMSWVTSPLYQIALNESEVPDKEPYYKITPLLTDPNPIVNSSNDRNCIPSWDMGYIIPSSNGLHDLSYYNDSTAFLNGSSAKTRIRLAGFDPLFNSNYPTATMFDSTKESPKGGAMIYNNTGPYYFVRGGSYTTGEFSGLFFFSTVATTATSPSYGYRLAYMG